MQRIQYLQTLAVTNWQTLGSATGGVSGTFQFPVTNPAPNGFYRSIFP